jgi:uncharacterized protein YcbK (DUF882 family)
MKSFNLSDHISAHFTYKEALWLPRWGRAGSEQDGLTDEVLARVEFLLKEKMDAVREYFGRPINVHVCWRPPAYNKLVGGAKKSAHLAMVDYAGNPLAPEAIEAAIDFDVEGLSCDEARQMILDDDMLETWGLRMENNPGSSWVHLDCREPLPGHSRFFSP